MRVEVETIELPKINLNAISIVLSEYKTKRNLLFYSATNRLNENWSHKMFRKSQIFVNSDFVTVMYDGK